MPDFSSKIQLTWFNFWGAGHHAPTLKGSASIRMLQNVLQFGIYFTAIVLDVIDQLFA